MGIASLHPSYALWFKDSIIMPGYLTATDEDAARVIALRAGTW